VLNLVNKEPKQINEINIQGRTALHLACENGRVNVVDYLLQRGAKFSSDHEGRTPMHFACIYGSSGCLDMLINQFTDGDAINSVDNEQNSALHLAAKGGHPRLVAMLLDHEAEIKSNCDEQNVLDVALQASAVSSGVLLTLTEHERCVVE
jgi:ankyrin repeat protein